MSVTQVEDVHVNGKDTKKITVQLRDENDVRLPVVLWGAFADYLNTNVQTAHGSVVICVIKYGKIKVWKDNRTISNAYNCSDVILNPDYIPYVLKFRAILPNDEGVLAVVNCNPHAVATGLSDKDDFFLHTPRKTICEVLESKEVSKCIVLCTVVDVDADMGWYYWSCKDCSKKVITVPVDDDDGVDDADGVLPHKFHCMKCNSDNPRLVARFKLHIRVMDTTGNIKLILFDNLAMQIIGHTANELAPKQHEKIQESDLTPHAITLIVGKSYLFKIPIDREHILYKNDTYKALKIINDDELISDFSDKDSQHDTDNTLLHSHSIGMYESTETTLMLTDSSGPSEMSATPDSTTSKRKGSPTISIVDVPDQTSATKKFGNVKIKMEKNEENTKQKE